MSIQNVFNKKIDVEFFKTNGDRGYQGERGPQGPQGLQGRQGAQAPNYVGCGYGVVDDASDAEVTVYIDDYINTVNGITAIKSPYAISANSTLDINTTGYRPIYVRGVQLSDSPIGDNVIFPGTISTFICDGENYHLIATDCNDCSYVAKKDNWKIIYPGSPDAVCWTSGTRTVPFSISESEKIVTFKFPIEFVSPPNVLISVIPVSYDSVGNCSADIINLTTNEVVLNVKREKVTSSVGVRIGLKAGC